MRAFLTAYLLLTSYLGFAQNFISKDTSFVKIWDESTIEYIKYKINKPDDKLHASLIRELKYYESSRFPLDKSRIEFLRASSSQRSINEEDISIIEITAEGEVSTYTNFLVVPHEKKWQIHEYIYTSGKWKYSGNKIISRREYVKIHSPYYCNNFGINSSNIVITIFDANNTKPKVLFYGRFSLCRESFFELFFRHKL